MSFDREPLVFVAPADDGWNSLAQWAHSKECYWFTRMSITTENQQKITEMGIKNIPKEFRCALTGQIMDDPVRLKSDNNKIIERRVLEETNGKSPFTDLPIEDNNVEECHALKDRINSFVVALNPRRRCLFLS
jgi:hypothetical protein